jgi:hypothetical protein
MPFEQKKLNKEDIEIVIEAHRKFYGEDYRLSQLTPEKNWIVNSKTGDYVLLVPCMMREDCERYLVYCFECLFIIDSSGIGCKYAFQNYPPNFEIFRDEVISIFSDIIILFDCFLLNAKPKFEVLEAFKSGKAKNTLFPLTRESFFDDNYDFTLMF